MKSFSSLTAAVALSAAAAACAHQPLPTTRISSADAAVRAATDAGAEQVPDAAMHVRLAREQIAQAEQLIREGETDRAEWLLVRAESDAAVARALVREARATTTAAEVAAEAKRETEQ